MKASSPQVIVCAGGGGVGKTTTSAALAVALATSGQRTLIVTIDPARRLAGAMGVPITDEVTRVPLPATEGRLYALMPDPRASMRTFIDQLFCEQPAAKAHLLTNRLYGALADAAAGVHELVAMNLVAHAASESRFDVIVIDTAPSRHAIDFVTYPGRLAKLLAGRTVTWLAGMAQRADGGSPAAGGLLAWGTGRIESVLARVTGPNLIRDTASLFGDLALVRERFVALAERSADLLLGPRTVYLLIAAPTGAAKDDVLFLAQRLDKLGRRPRAIVLNRSAPTLLPLAASLRTAPDIPASIVEILALLDEESAARKRAADGLATELGKQLPQLAMVRLPNVEMTSPSAIVEALSRALTPHLPALVPASG